MPFSLSNPLSRPARTPAVSQSLGAAGGACCAAGPGWLSLGLRFRSSVGDRRPRRRLAVRLRRCLLCWFVLTRRGLVRLLGTFGVLFGISGLVAYLVAEHRPLLIVLGSMAVFVFASRYAVRHDQTTVRALHRSWRRVRPARTGVLIINPNSGGGTANRFDLVEEARKRDVEPLLLEPGMNFGSWPRQRSQTVPT